MMAVIIEELAFTLAILLIISLLVLYFKRRRVTSMINNLPGPKSHPVFGYAYELIGLSVEDMVALGLKEFKNYPDGLIRMWMGPMPMVFLINPTYVEALLSSNVHIDKSFVYNFLHSWLGHGLLNSTGAKWHSRRKLLTPAFHFRILEEFLPTFNEQSKILVEKISANNECNLYQLITLCSLDIICATAMGTDVQAQLNQDSEYVNAVSKATEEIFFRFASPWFYPDLIYKNTCRGRRYQKYVNILKNFTRKVIENKSEEFRKRRANNKDSQNEDDLFGGRRRRAFLDLLLEYSDDGRVLSNDDIQEEVDTFMFEGHDTTSSAMYWTLYHLGLNPHIQDKLHKDLDLIFENSDRPVEFEDLSKMKYLEMVCKEALRISPSVPFFARKLKEDLKVGQYVIPAGVECTIVPFLTHRMEEHFPEPLRFDPDRFLPENCQGRHPYAYIPFSAGPRNCIGQKFALIEEKVVLANILRKFTVTTEKIPEYPEGPYFKPEVTNKPSPKCKIHIRPRKSD